MEKHTLITENTCDASKPKPLAEALLSQGRLKDASDAFCQILEHEQTNIKAMIALGRIERRLGDNAAACNYFTAAISIDPGNLNALTELAGALRDLDRREGATAIYRKILATDPQHAQSQMGLGWIARSSHNDEAALVHFNIAAERLRAAAEDDPDNFHIPAELATVLRELDRPEQAAAIYKTILGKNPDHAPSHMGLGWIARRRGDDEAALAHFATASELIPMDLAPQIARARVLASMRRFEESESVYRRLVLEAPKNSQVRAGLGDLARTRHDWAGALEQFSTAVELDPRNVGFRIELGRTFCGLSRWDDAERIYRSVIQDSPGNIEATIGLAETAKARGDATLALALFEEAAAAAPLDLRPKREIRRLKTARGSYDWRTEVEEAAADALCTRAPVETQIEAAKTLVEYGLTEVARPVLTRLETRFPAARQLLMAVRQIERMGLAQPGASLSADGDPAENQLDSLQGFLEMPVPNTETLLIVFGGGRNRVSITFSLLHKILRKTAVSIVYCRDLQREWYSRGVVGLGTDFQSTVAGFTALAGRLGAKRILTLGNCVGCLGALRFGLYLNAEGVLGLDPKIRPASQEPHRKRQLAVVRKNFPQGHKNIYISYLEAISRPRVTLIFGEHHSVDSSGARSMADVPDVAVTGLPDSADPVKDLLVRGLLEPVLKEFVATGAVSPDLHAQISTSATPQYKN